MKRLAATLSALPLALIMMTPSSVRADDEEEREFPKLEEVVDGFERKDGFLRLYRKEKEERLLAAVSSDMLGQPFFLATSVSGGSEYAGWQWQDKLVRFDRWGKKLLLIELNTQQRADEEKPLAEVVRRTYADRLLADLDIEGEGEEGELLVDLGELLSRGFRTFFGGYFALDTGLARFTKVKAFPQNVEVAVNMPLYGDGTFMTLHYSISQLPSLEEYTPRVADERIGYFVTAIRDYTSGDPREGRMVRLINRWKLEKADPELPLSPPKEPIVFYVEKTVPIAYRQAVQEAILEWNRAFEEVGITGAIVVRQQTETQFADIDPEDVRYNFFRWITSETPFAMGPSRVDPRNGRILDADIIFDDSMLRGYMRDYDVLIREAPSKLLTPAMARLLEQKPELHPLARFTRREGSPEVERVRALLRELQGEGRAVTLEGLLEQAAEPRVERRADLARVLPARAANAASCQLGEMLPQQVGLAQLALGGVMRVGPSGAPLEDYLTAIVRETVMHEVGHTLGLRHNFKASSMLALDAINNGDKPPATSASVMDYHPLNLSSDPDRQGNFLPRTIGPYDHIAIEYGYKLCDEDAEELQAVPRKVAEQGLPYATDEDLGSPDPLITQWDMGNDPLAFAEHRVALVQALWSDLEGRSVADGESYSRLRRALNITLFEVQQSAALTARLVGGLSFFRDRKGDPNARAPISVVEAAKQREALAWLGEQIFSGAALQIPADLRGKLAAGRWVHWGSPDGNASLDYSVMDRVAQIQSWALFFVTADDVLARIWENEQRAKATGAPTPLTLPELFDTLEAAIFSELERQPGGEPTALDPAISSVRQNLQDAYVRRLIQIAVGDGISPPVANKLAWSRLRELERRFAPLLTGARLDPYTRAHLEVLKAKSEAARTPEYVHVASGAGCALAPAAAAGATPWAALGLLGLGLAGLLVRRRRAA